MWNISPDIHRKADTWLYLENSSLVLAIKCIARSVKNVCVFKLMQSCKHLNISIFTKVVFIICVHNLQLKLGINK